MTTSARKENRWRKQLQEENDQRDKVKRELEVLGRSVNTHKEAAKTIKSHPTRAVIRNWMRRNASDYESATELVEGASANFDIPAEWLDDETHWIWDIGATVSYDSN